MKPEVNLIPDALRIEDEIIGIRRQIHANPELSFHEFDTASLVATKLRSLGIKVKTGVGGNGVVGLMRGSLKGNVVGLRADMDALPINEALDLPFKSKKNGIMHACGHDAHVAMLLGAAMLLDMHKSELHGHVKFIFQPAEEHGGRGGAKPMIEEGILDSPKVNYIFGQHISSDKPSRVFSLKRGPILAANDFFKITIKGRGGHGSQPHKTIDPIVISSHVIMALQAVRSRMIDQLQPIVISVCNVHSGSRDNIIPDEALLEGTIRTFDEKTRTQIKKRVRQVTDRICRSFDATCEVEFMKDTYPVTVNDPEVAKKAFSVLKQVKGTRTVETKPMLYAEDFSRFLQRTRGAFYFLGTYNPKKGCISPNHSSTFKVDEQVLKYGAVSLAQLAIAFGNKT